MNALRRCALTIAAIAILAPLSAQAESIRSFGTDLTLSQDGMLHVVETIQYDFGSAERHGIFRDIPLSYSAEGVEQKGIQISGLAVADESGRAYEAQTSRQGGNLHIRIGDPNALITGVHSYVISYEVAGAVIPLSDADEIYWNATGDQWPVAIESAHATLRMPAKPANASCYQGTLGSKESCSASIGDTGALFDASRALAPGEGMTIAAAFPKNTVPVISVVAEEPSDFGVPARYAGVVSMFLALLGLAIGISSVGYAARLWYRHGRDPRGRGTIIPYYEAPKDISPMEAALLVRQKIVGRDMTAELIWMARMGAFKISNESTKVLGIFPWKDYRLIETGGQQSLAAEHDRDLYEALFYGSETSDGVRSIHLSGMDKTHFQMVLQGITDSVKKSVVDKGLYDGDSKRYATIAGFTGAGMLAATFFAVLTLATQTWGALILFLGLVVGGIALLIAAYFMPRVTLQGALMREELLGLKEYLQIAEKDRLAFHNAPEKKPETFEALLPMAIMFGVEKAWAKEFADMYVPPPSWYSGNAGTFAAIGFANDMHSFSGSFTSAIAVSASGSGGGGFSGGGGGGGGGGSW